ncbi:glyoxalase [Nitrospira sp.]|nr:glyoxalase [Nitrospira sp.]
MTKNPVIWFEIDVQDMPRAKAFYEAVFGVTLEPLKTPDSGPSETWAFPTQREGAGAAGALAKIPGGSNGEGIGTIVYFSSQDCAVETERVVPSGGRVVKEKSPIGEYGYLALAADLEGNLFGIHSGR